MSNSLLRSGLSVLFVNLVTSCNGPLVNLSPLAVDTWPKTDNQVLASADAIRVTFSDSVVHASAQGLLSVSSVDGTASGDSTWSANTLIFMPVPGLSSGKRYRLEFNGQVTLTDGRQFTVSKEVPFFVGTSSNPMRLITFAPQDGASTTGSVPLVLTFDSPVDPTTFQTGFSLSPSTTTSRVWSADQKTVTITPTCSWTTATLYSWQLATSLESAQGVNLAAPVNHCFLTNADQLPPQIVSVVPGVWASSTWSAAGTDLNTLIKGDAFLVTTSKSVDLATLGTAFHLTPAIKGHLLAQNTTQYVYVPDEDLALGTAYTLQVSTDLQDTMGNAMTSAWLMPFTPQIPYLHVSEIDLIGMSSTPYTTLSQPNTFPLCLPSGVSSDQVVIKVVFSTPFSASDKAQFGVLSFCQTLFPTTGTSVPGSPTLVTVAFENSDKTAVLTYRGISVSGTGGVPDYYQVKIPGGTSGITASGQTLKQDVWIDFTTSS